MCSPGFGTCRLRAGVGVHLALAAGHDDVYEAAGVCETLLRAALGDLLLLLLLDLCAHVALAMGVPKRCACSMAVVVMDTRSGDEAQGFGEGGERIGSVEGGCLSYLGGLRLDLTGTRERTVDLTHVGV